MIDDHEVPTFELNDPLVQDKLPSMKLARDHLQPESLQITS
jgi:hypothetical protein